MRAVIWLLALFALAVAITLIARLDQGYVIVVYPPWRMELSFMLALFLLFGMLTLAYILLRLLGIALNLSGDMRAWRAKRQRQKADEALLDALRAQLDGHQEQARMLARKVGGDNMAPDLVDRLAREPGVPPAGASDGKDQA